MDKEFDGHYDIWGGDISPKAVEIARSKMCIRDRLPISDGSSSWVLLPLSEGTDAPSYTDIARRMGKYILPLSSPDDA